MKYRLLCLLLALACLLCMIPAPYTNAAALDRVTVTKTIGHATGNILYWDSVEGAKLYQVYRLSGSTWELLKNTGSLGYKDETAQAGVKHYYKIVARNGELKSDIKTTASTAVTRPAAKLDNVTVTRSIGHVTGNILYWGAVEGAKLYQVYRLEGSSWVLLKNTGSLGYKDETAPVGTKCYYKIIARNGDVKSDIQTTVSTGVIRPEPPHEHKYTKNVVKPTCENKGYTEYKCACGHSYTADEKDATGHKWDNGKVTIKPTTEAEGEKTFTCKVCGKTRKEVLPKEEKPKQEVIDVAAIEAYGRSYAASIGFTVDTSLGFGNGGYYPAGRGCIRTMQEGRSSIAGYTAAVKRMLMAADYTNNRTDSPDVFRPYRYNCKVEYSHTDEQGYQWYTFTVFYG